MNNTELLITNVYIPPASPCNGHYSPPSDHLLTGTDSLVLWEFNAHHSLWHSGTTNTRGNQTGGFGHYFQLCSPKYRFTHKTPWKCRPQFSRCIISISISHHLVRIANTHDHELRPSAHPYQITDNCHLISCPDITYINPKKADWTGYRYEIERKLSSRHLPTDCQKDE